MAPAAPGSIYPGSLPPLRTAALAGFVLFVMGFVTTGAAAWTLSRRPRSPQPEPLPQSRPYRTEALRLVAADGLELGAWCIDGPGERATIVLIHGIGGSRSALLPRIDAFVAMGLDLVVPTLRAHGDSDGERLDFGPGIALDVEAAVVLAKERWPGQPLHLHGLSLGAAAVAEAGPRVAAQVDAFLLESPFATLEVAVQRRIPQAVPAFAAPWMAKAICLWAPLVLGAPMGRFSPLASAARLPAGERLWVLAGDRDTRAPVEDAAAILDVVPGARLFVFPGADHGELRPKDPGRYEAVIEEMLAETAPPAGAAAP